jgi:hypothetical protein
MKEHVLSARKILTSFLLLLIVLFIIYTDWNTRIHVKLKLNKLSLTTINSNCYLELLKGTLLVSLTRKNNEYETKLTNNSNLSIPTENPHRTIIYTTEILNISANRISHEQRKGLLIYKDLSKQFRS